MTGEYKNFWAEVMDNILFGRIDLPMAVRLSSQEATEAWDKLRNIVTLRILSVYLPRGPEAAVRAVQAVIGLPLAKKFLDKRLKRPDDPILWTHISNSKRQQIGEINLYLNDHKRELFQNANNVIDWVARDGWRSEAAKEAAFQTLRNISQDDDQIVIDVLRSFGQPTVKEILEAAARDRAASR
jgi:hypothetical protein